MVESTDVAARRRVRELRDEGYSRDAVARQMTGEGWPRPNGGRWRARDIARLERVD